MKREDLATIREQITNNQITLDRALELVALAHSKIPPVMSQQSMASKMPGQRPPTSWELFYWAVNQTTFDPSKLPSLLPHDRTILDIHGGVVVVCDTTNPDMLQLTVLFARNTNIAMGKPKTIYWNYYYKTKTSETLDSAGEVITKLHRLDPRDNIEFLGTAIMETIARWFYFVKVYEGDIKYKPNPKEMKLKGKPKPALKLKAAATLSYFYEFVVPVVPVNEIDPEYLIQEPVSVAQ